MLRSSIFCALVLSAPLAASAAEEGRLSEPAIRSFIARQDEAWRSADFEGVSRAFQPDATIVGIFYGADGAAHVHADTPKSEAEAMAAFTARRTNRSEQTEISSIRIAPDGQSATIALVRTRDFDEAGKHRHRVFDDTALVVLDGGEVKGTADVSIERPPG